MSQKTDVVIVGAGLSGLNAAIHLQQEGINVKVLEATDRVGGRIKTEEYKGFLLDYGFQVLLTAYPEAQAALDYDSLHLNNFYPGVLAQFQGKIYKLADPFRKPIDAMSGFFMPLLNFGDKLKIVALRNRFKRFSIEKIFELEERSTFDYLRDWSFSKKIIRSFFKPFMGGIFLEPNLETSNRMFAFVFKMFGEGYAALPKNGMEAIPKQLTQKLKEGTVVCNTKAAKVEEGKVTLESGETIDCKAVLIAVDAIDAATLLPRQEIDNQMNGTWCIYFETDTIPSIQEPFLILNSNKAGLINNVAIPSLVHHDYAPVGKHLVSVTVIKSVDFSEKELVKRVKDELEDWFDEAERFQFLKSYKIERALPARTHLTYPHKNDIKAVSKGVYVCGDHTHDPSINGALRSGRLVAEAINWDLALAVNQN